MHHPLLTNDPLKRSGVVVWSRKSNNITLEAKEKVKIKKKEKEEKETLGIPKRISIHVTVANVLLLSLLLFVNEASYSLNQIKYTRRGLLRSTAAASPLLKKKKVWSQMPKAVHVSIFIFSPSICKKHLFPPFPFGLSRSHGRWEVRGHFFFFLNSVFFFKECILGDQLSAPKETWDAHKKRELELRRRDSSWALESFCKVSSKMVIEADVQ